MSNTTKDKIIAEIGVADQTIKGLVNKFKSTHIGSQLPTELENMSPYSFTMRLWFAMVLTYSSSILITSAHESAKTVGYFFSFLKYTALFGMGGNIFMLLVVMLNFVELYVFMVFAGLGNAFILLIINLLSPRGFHMKILGFFHSFYQIFMVAYFLFCTQCYFDKVRSEDYDSTGMPINKQPAEKAATEQQTQQAEEKV